MGITNLQHGLTNRLARYHGELETKRRELANLERAAALIPAYREEIVNLEKLIQSVTFFLSQEGTNFDPENVTPIQPHKHTSPIKFGELGPTALAVLRDAKTPMRCRDLAMEVLMRKGIAPVDRPLLDKTANSLGRYLAKHRGELVESDGQYPALWRVIR